MHASSRNPGNLGIVVVVARMSHAYGGRDPVLARSDPGARLGELATTDEFIIKLALSTSIMSIASEKTA